MMIILKNKMYTLCLNTIDLFPLSCPDVQLLGNFPPGKTFIKWFALLLHFVPNYLTPSFYFFFRLAACYS